MTRDDDPDTTITICLSLPVVLATIHLNFLGPEAPGSFWSFGPLVDELLIPAAPEHGTPVSPLPNHSVSVTFANPIRGSIYGISWTWGE